MRNSDNRNAKGLGNTLRVYLEMLLTPIYLKAVGSHDTQIVSFIQVSCKRGSCGQRLVYLSLDLAFMYKKPLSTINIKEKNYNDDIYCIKVKIYSYRRFQQHQLAIFSYEVGKGYFSTYKSLLLHCGISRLTLSRFVHFGLFIKKRCLFLNRPSIFYVI